MIKYKYLKEGLLSKVRIIKKMPKKKIFRLIISKKFNFKIKMNLIMKQ